MFTDVFGNFRICLERNELDLAKVLSAPGLAWEATLKKTAVKLNLLTDINMLLMTEQVIGEGTCHSIYWYAKANKKHMKNYDENKQSLYLK